MQINLEVPEVVLGPNVIACMGRMIARTSLCQGPHLLTQALRLLLLRHHTHNPAAAVSAAVRAGDWAGAEERLRELPRAAQANLAAEANDLAACDDATGGADAKRRGKGKRKCAPGSVALPSPGAGTQRDAVLCWRRARSRTGQVAVSVCGSEHHRPRSSTVPGCAGACGSGAVPVRMLVCCLYACELNGGSVLRSLRLSSVAGAETDGLMVCQIRTDISSAAFPRPGGWLLRFKQCCTPARDTEEVAQTLRRRVIATRARNTRSVHRSWPPSMHHCSCFIRECDQTAHTRLCTGCAERAANGVLCCAGQRPQRRRSSPLSGRCRAYGRRC